MSTLLFQKPTDVTFWDIIELLSFTNITTTKLKKILPELNNLNKDVIEQIEIEAKYSGYLDRQRADISDFKKEEGLKIPKSINYNYVGSLSNEIVEKLSKTNPKTLAHPETTREKPSDTAGIFS